MSVFVLRYGLCAPTQNEALIRAQMRAAHDYANDLVAIERGRRWALRLVDRSSPEVCEAEEALKSATRSDKKAALSNLRNLRKARREQCAEELARIQTLEEQLRRDARALTPTYWGTYLGVEASHQQSRAMPLYEEDGLTDNDPKFASGPRTRELFTPKAPKGIWWLQDAQLGMQIQATKPLDGSGLLKGEDSRVKIILNYEGSRGRRCGELWLRIGSNGREPVWAIWPIKMHRAIPENAQIKWVHVSLRAEGPWERWFVEVTIDSPTPRWKTQARPKDGAIAVEWAWYPQNDGSIRVGAWQDDQGHKGTIDLPLKVVERIKKPEGIRAVRDMIANDAKPKIAADILKSGAPEWAQSEARVLHLVKSFRRLHMLAKRWRTEGLPPLKVLDDWYQRDTHLWQYESGVRGDSLGHRREIYRLIAAQWRRQYRTILLSDQDLSREARWGDDSDTRFTASPSELRLCLRNAFGLDAQNAKWRDKVAEDDERDWCERTMDRWIRGGRVHAEIPVESKSNRGNAWASRKAKKAAKEGARESTSNSL